VITAQPTDNGLLMVQDGKAPRVVEVLENAGWVALGDL
jgi:hypothetical protein